MITDKGSPFNSKGLDDYCTEENIQNLQIPTSVPRGNGQVERIHRTLIPVLTKLSIDDPTKCDVIGQIILCYVKSLGSVIPG
ncbi:integrase catalytic domain-containing protein [Trichonephila clavipes]|nr:integrase catalytic domain-containing protein [Trichonephila clavipes]